MHNNNNIDLTDRLKITAKVLENFCIRHHIRELSVFGSATREDFRTDSDIDILVEFQPEAIIGMLALSRAQHELEDLLGRPVDLVPKRSLKPLIRDTVLSSAQVIYAA